MLAYCGYKTGVMVECMELENAREQGCHGSRILHIEASIWFLQVDLA